VHTNPVQDDIAPVDGPLSEDYLFLNVWRPADAAANSALPVMVWIHGGGFLNGGSSAPIFDGTALARQGVVVVTLNYRLGRLGFFALPALIAAQPNEVGNFGLMDQVAALKWVHENIGAFGGDRNRVTIVGESAGGASVLILLTSPEAKGLFRGAMIMSGGGRQPLVAREMTGGGLFSTSAEREDRDFARSAGIRGEDAAALEALRALPAQTLVEGWGLPELLKEAILALNPKLAGTPAIGGGVISASPQEIFARQAESEVPVIIGSTAIDIPLVFPPKLFPFRFFGDEADKARSVYDPTGEAKLPEVLLSIGSDMTMHEPSRFVAREVTAAGRPAWLYRYTYVAEKEPTRAMGAAHAREVPFLFDNAAVRYPDTVTDMDREAGRQFSAYLVNFVKTGDPNGAGVPQWPKFDPSKYELMNFTLDDGPVFGPDPRNPRVELVERATDAAAK
jgi:para-nitrobenzyl esterase